MSELAYKFTRAGARSPFTGFAWRPGEWIEAGGALDLCVNGIHACRLEAMPRWIDDELWRIEIDDRRDEFEGVVVARRARLLERIYGWNAETARDLARSCASQARKLADESPDPLIRQMADEIAAMAEIPDVPLTMYCTAHACDEAMHGGYVAERKRQADWLRERLQLEPA